MPLPFPRGALALCIAWICAFSANAGPLRVFPDNPHLVEFRGRPVILRTLGEHYSSVVNNQFDFIPYLDALQRDRLNLTRVFLVGFRVNSPTPVNDPLAVTPADFLQPWLRNATGGSALDGLTKWDFDAWNEAYFERLESFVRACDERNIVVELTFFSTLYDELQWQASPFHPSNNTQGLGPADRYQCFRPENQGLLAVQEAVMRRVVQRLNPFDNVYYEIQNEPFWNDPGVGDDDEVAFHEAMLQVIRDEESLLPKRHLVAHNFPQKSRDFTGDFDIIREHYPAAVPGTPVRGAEALLDEQYDLEKPLSLGETNPLTAEQARLEAWMFILGGGAMYNGLDYTDAIYTVETPGGDSELGRTMRRSIRNIGTFADTLDLPALRRDRSWIVGDLPAGARLQAVSHPGQQYAAYLHHGSSGTRNFQLAYSPIDATLKHLSLMLDLPEGSWRVVWTRPETLEEIRVETLTHAGGTVTFATVAYHADLALRIDRTGEGDLTSPPYPSGLSGDSQADGSLVLSWQPVMAADLATYRIYRKEEEASDPSFIALADVDVGQTSHLDATAVPGITYQFVVAALDENGNESPWSDPVRVLSELRNIPFLNSPHALPGKLQAEQFDVGGPNIAYLDHSPGNSGSVYRETDEVDIAAIPEEEAAWWLTDVESGEWLEFTVQIANSGVYRPDFRVPVPTSGGEWRVEHEQTGLVATVPIPAVEGDPGWLTVSGPEAILPAGRAILRITYTGESPGGLDWLEFVPIPKVGPVANAGPDQQVVDEDSDGYATITLDASGSLAGDAPILTHAWTWGAHGSAEGEAPSVTLPLGLHAVKLTLTDAHLQQATAITHVRVIPAAFSNGGFESGFDGWIATGNLSIQWGGLYTSSEGVRLVAFNSSNRPPNATLTQSFATTPGQIYELAFDFGYLAYVSQPQRLEVRVTGDGVLLTKTYELIRPANSSVNVRWESRSLLFTADSAFATLLFKDLSTATDSLDLTLDNVRIIPRITRTLDVASSPFDGVAVALAPADSSGSGGGNTPFRRIYQNGATVDLTAPAAPAGYRFEQWLDGETLLGTSAALRVTMNSNRALTAVYAVAPPSILSHPANQRVPEGGDATFSVTAQGIGDLFYQWRFNGAEIEGATAATLALSGVSAGNAGSYDVVVSNAAGATASRAAALVVASGAEFANGGFENGLDAWTASGNVSLQQGGLYSASEGTHLAAFNAGNSTPNGSLSQTFATTPSQTYELSFDFGILSYTNSQQRLQVQITGNTLLASNTYVISRSGNSTLRWEHRSLLFAADSALSTVVFTDVSTTTNALDLLLDNVKLVPRITRVLSVASTPPSGVAVAITPADSTGAAGGNTAFQRFYQHGAVVDLAAPLNASGHRFEKWTANAADLSTSASLRVTMDIDHALTAVYVEAPPVIVTQPVTQRVVEGGNAAFSVSAEGAGTLAYQWRHNDAAIPGATSATLTITGVTAGNTGRYDVIVTNNAGSTASQTAMLEISSATEMAGVSNGGFESDWNGWTVTGNASVKSHSVYLPPEGSRVAVFNDSNRTPNATLTQSFTTTPGRTYGIAFHIGVLAYNNSQQRLEVSVTGNTPRYSNIHTISRSSSSLVRWEPRSFVFTADSSSSTLRFRDVSTTTDALDLLLDHVRVSVPAQSAALAASASLPPPPVEPAAASAGPPGLLPGTPSLKLTPGGCVVVYQTSAAGTYELQSSVDLEVWIHVETRSTTAAGPIEFLDPSPPAARKFYRIATTR